MIVRIENFVGILNIPDLSNDTCNGPTPSYEMLQEVASMYERHYIYKMLGELTQPFYDNLASTGDEWEDLREGGEYTYEGQTIAFVGVRKILAHFIYWEFMRNSQTTTGVNVEARQNGINAVESDRAAKMLNAWNTGVNYLYSSSYYEPTLQAFLDERPEFDDWYIDYHALCHQNAFNI